MFLGRSFVRNVGTFTRANSRVKRKSGGEPYTLPDGRVVRFEIATQDDVEELNEVHMAFANRIPMYRAIGRGAVDLELAPYFFAATKEKVSYGGSIIGLIDDKIVGAMATRYYNKDEVVLHFGRRALPGEKPVFEMLPDYGDVFDSMPGTHKSEKILKTLLVSAEEQWAKFMPDDLEKLCVDEAIIVHDSIRRTNIGSVFFERSNALSKKLGCNYEGGVAVTKAMQKTAKNHGYEVLYALPFDKFMIHGEHPIKSTFDGTTEIEVAMKKL